MYNNNYSYPTTTSGANTGMLAAFTGVWLLFWLVVAVVTIVGLWKVFVKAKQPGWAAIVPIYNIYVLLKIVGRPGWWLILYLIPFVNFVVLIIVSIDLAKSFGKDAVFGVLALFLFGVIGYLILGFGDAKYAGPSISGSSAPRTAA